MAEPQKMLIAGVGGQGVVYLTRLIVEAAVLSDIPVATSELHGLAQRSGTVVAGITFGENGYGFIEKAGADFLIALEPLEAQRCLPFLNRRSKAVIDNRRIPPHAVNAGRASYPDIPAFVEYLKQNIAEVVFNVHFEDGLPPVLRNVYLLGRASVLDGFPVPYPDIEKAIEAAAEGAYKEQSMRAFRMGRRAYP